MPKFVLPIDWTDYHVYFNDFDTYAAGDWTVTETQSDATQALLANADGGAMLLTNSAADNDVNQLQLTTETFLFELGKAMHFKCRFKVSDATQSDVYVGLVILDTDMVGGVTDGIFFRKDDGDAHLDFVVVKDSTATTKAALADLVDDTYVVVEFHYDGTNPQIDAYVDGALVGYAALTNVCDDEPLTVTLSLTNGAAAAKTMTIDYVLAAKDR